MTLKALSHDVRSILCASAQITNYKTAIAELIYNSLDAESTSIAIRVNIQENTIQVIDNGCGIMKSDFKSLGKRYMTSKVADMATLKSMPKYYGFRGEFLTNLIEISQSVSIISRYKDGEATWVQTFHENKRKHLVKMTTRPSKGTTIDVKGFLYNLNIQKQAINPLNDLQKIKTFLEQISIVHSNISLSLRDDSKNEIIFKIHKKRDIYQTLLTLFKINRSDVQELQIEKNQYRVKAYIGKTDKILESHWIYLNGKILQNFSILHKITNEYLRKYLHLTDTKKSRYKNNCEEEHLFKSNIPFYFIFITCPYNDYDISITSRQSFIEFKNWEQIKVILEKLIKFYVDDINLIKGQNEPNNMLQLANRNNNEDTRHKIKKIVDKILGSNSKNIRVSQLQNGIKGRLIKRRKRNKKKEDNKRKSFPKLDEILHSCDDGNATNIAKPKKENLVIDKDSTSNDKPRKVTATNENTAVSLKKNKIHVDDPKIENIVKRTRIKKLNKNNKNQLGCEPIAKLDLKPVQNNSICKSKRNKIRQSKNNNRQIETYRFLNDTDTIPEHTRIVAQKVQEFLNNTKFKYSNVPQLNKNTINNYVRHKIKSNPFKTTYDLVQTIIESQQDQDNRSINQGTSSFEIGIKGHNVIKHKHTAFNNMFSKYCSSYREEQKSKYENIPFRLQQSKLTYKNTYNINIDRQYKVRQVENVDDIPANLNSHSLRCGDIYKEDFLEHCTQNYISSCMSNMSNTYTETALTYQSHKYIKNNYFKMYDENTQTYTVITQNKNCSISKAKNTKFITNQSIGNFNPSRNEYLRSNNINNRYDRSFAKQSYNEHAKQIMNKSYTIEFRTSNEINNPLNNEEIPNGQQSEFPKHNMDSNNHYFIPNSYSPSYKPTNFGNTYTLHSYNESTNCNVTQHGENSVIPHMRFLTNSVHCSNIDNNDIIEMDVENNNSQVNKDNHEASLISKQESINDEINIDEDLQPMNFCETVFHENESIEKEFACSFYVKSKSNDSLYNNITNSNNKNFEKCPAQTVVLQTNNENVSHHFNCTANHANTMTQISRQSLVSNMINVKEINNKIDRELQNLNRYNNDCDNNIDLALSGINDNNFNFKDRLRFLPKGMSQIFEKNGSKAICDYNLDEDYYEDEIYNDFANEVQMQTEIYEPTVQNVEDLASRGIHKFKIRVQKDNSSLFFDEMSLKQAQVLNQVDCKFITARMKGRSRQFQTLEDYLILFDQHAVHERIRLEKNLTDYLNEDRWKSVPLDNIIMKMSKDEIVYLHNYKDKFNQLGLQWSILDKNEVSISAIPEAILGKKPREVDKVMRAIKSLIVEEINVIKLQKGCISSYPKSIMDLVFSEACRYAIKFGDKLSKKECVDLLRELSNCKTPFQCAHGRPVMAVLVDIKASKHEYNINIESLKSYKRNSTAHAK